MKKINILKNKKMRKILTLLKRFNKVSLLDNSICNEYICDTDTIINDYSIVFGTKENATIKIINFNNVYIYKYLKKRGLK